MALIGIVYIVELILRTSISFISTKHWWFNYNNELLSHI